MTGTDRVPLWSLVGPAAAAAFAVVSATGLLPMTGSLPLTAAALLLGLAVFAAVHHAEVIALRVGEPFGSITLAIAVTVIEVALIVSILLTGGPGSEAVARDTVFATVMIVLNGVVGLCLVLGAQRHHEQSFRVDGAAAALAVLGTLAVITLILPNFTTAARGPIYSPVQLLGVGLVSLSLYLVFVFVQTVRHRDYFLSGGPGDTAAPPPARVAAAALVLLLVSLVAVVLLAKGLSKPLGAAITAAGLPQLFLGIVIAAVVLMPEGLAAARSALANRVQGSMNLALGSAIATIGLTVPSVAVVSLLIGVPLELGLSDKDMVLLLLTLFASTLTLGTGRTTVLQGAVHLVIFAVFLLVAVIP
jgi:Ca2+:H+ antiporter